jgi:proteasome accessory factor C
MLQWAAQHPDGVPVADLCARFRLKPADLARELDLASMIGADAANYDEMPFEVFVEDGLVFVRLFAFRRPMRLTPAEGLALVAAADVLVDRAGPDAAGPLERALEKLAALLGIEPGQAIEVELDPDGGPTGARLRGAIEADQQVAFTYWTYGSDEVRRRTADPWDLFVERSTWYLVAWDHDADAARHFRLDRMDEVEVLDAARSSRAPSDLAKQTGVDGSAPQVVLDLGPGARWVAEAHPVLDAEAMPDDRLRVTLAVSAPAWLERLLLRLGDEAEIVRIDERLGSTDLAASAARRVLARYEAADGATSAGH